MAESQYITDLRAADAVYEANLSAQFAAQTDALAATMHAADIVTFNTWAARFARHVEHVVVQLTGMVYLQSDTHRSPCRRSCNI